MTYQYWTIRWVPDVVRGEFVNIGVLVGSEERNDWAIQSVENFTRANSLGGDAGRAKSFIRALERRVEQALLPDGVAWGGERLTFADVERLRAHQSNSVQLAAPRRLHAASAEAGMQMIYALMVLEPAVISREQKRVRLARRLERDLQDRLPRELVTQRRAKARADGQRGGFDLLARTPERLQLANAWSFTARNVDTLAREHQSWAWFISNLRDDGGQITVNGDASVVIPPDVPLVVVHDMPKTDEQHDVYKSARIAWDSLDIKAFEQGEMHAAAEYMREQFVLAR